VPTADTGGPRRPGTGRRHRAARLVAKLPERQRLAVFLRYYADLDYAAIGTALGTRTGTVSATLAAGIRSLRRMAEEVEL
jgi:RNA polymerase sigma factor (sigma-70 family)